MKALFLTFFLPKVLLGIKKDYKKCFCAIFSHQNGAQGYKKGYKIFLVLEGIRARSVVMANFLAGFSQHFVVSSTEADTECLVQGTFGY